MNKILSMIIFFILVVLLSGCASNPTGEQFSKLMTPTYQKSLVYLYRPDEYYGKGLSFKVKIDDEQIGDIGNGGYMIIPIYSGNHLIEVNGFGYENNPRTISVSDMSIVFLKVVTKTKLGGFAAELSLELIQEKDAKRDMASLNREPERFVNDKL